MAGKFKVKKKTNPTKDNTVSGNTLEEIWESLRKNALACSDAVGMAETGIKTPQVTKFDEEKSKKGPEKKGNEAWTVAGKPGEVKLIITVTLPSWAYGSHAITSIPQPSAYEASERPMRPKPTIPRVLPRSSVPLP